MMTLHGPPQAPPNRGSVPFAKTEHFAAELRRLETLELPVCFLGTREQWALAEYPGGLPALRARVARGDCPRCGHNYDHKLSGGCHSYLLPWPRSYA